MGKNGQWAMRVSDRHHLWMERAELLQGMRLTSPSTPSLTIIVMFRKSIVEVDEDSANSLHSQIMVSQIPFTVDAFCLSSLYPNSRIY